MTYYEMQNIARLTFGYIKSVIKPGMTLIDVRKLCEAKLLELGADSFWYYDIGAFCFSGKDTTISISGREYITPNIVIKEDDIITIDLSPQYNNIWGDYARTIVIENGIVKNSINEITNVEWKNGLILEDKLHEKMKNFVNRNTTFNDLFIYINDYIKQKGYVNFDFNGNLGHSIVKNKEDRVYIEKGNNLKLSDVKMFTFEPHIGLKNSAYGFKKESIYYFEENELVEL